MDSAQKRGKIENDQDTIVEPHAKPPILYKRGHCLQLHLWQWIINGVSENNLIEGFTER
jgi:hypothetical protein